MYNATIYQYASSGKLESVFVGEVTPDGRVVRSNAIQCSGLEGTPAYHEYLLKNFPRIKIVRDNCEGYKRIVRGLAVPPQYKNL